MLLEALNTHLYVSVLLHTCKVCIIYMFVLNVCVCIDLMLETLTMSTIVHIL